MMRSPFEWNPQSKHRLMWVLFAVLAAYGLWYAQVKQAKNTKIVEDWIQTLGANKWNKYSQSGEDGILDKIFLHIGNVDKIYVEFGVEDCQVQCNTKKLREEGWDVKNSLLMDGGYENKDINLHKVIFWPSNIVELFERFGVPYNFDLLSVDTDAYDWFMLETIFEAGYKPRVVVSEINSNFGPEDAKSIMPPKDGKSWQRWDGTTYHGSSILALNYLFNRFQYSVVFCTVNNCIAVRDDALGAYIRRPYSEIHVERPGLGHRCDYSNRSMAVIDPSGRWMGETDEGLGSPKIRHTGCNPVVLDKKPYIEDIPQATVEQ